MKKRKIFDRIFVFAITLITLLTSFPINTFADISLQDWQLEVEKDIVNAYKIKADEQNVAKIRGKDSKIGDIVEVIYEENTQTEKVGVALEQNSTDITKVFEETFVNNWAILLENYALSTGWINGTPSEIGAQNSSYGYVYTLNNTGVHDFFAHPEQWDSCKTKINQYIKEDANNICDYYKNHPIQLELMLDYDPGESHNPAQSTDRPESLDYWISYNGHKITGARDVDIGSWRQIVLNAIGQNNSLIVERHLKANNILEHYLNDYSIEWIKQSPNSYFAFDGQNVLDKINSISARNSGQHTYTISIKVVESTNSDITTSQNFDNSWNSICYFTAAMYKQGGVESDEFWRKMDFKNNEHYKLRRNALMEFIGKVYMPVYLDKFKLAAQYMSTDYDNVLRRYGYKANNNRDLMYSGAIFATSGWGDNFYTLVTSGYYYDPDQCLTVNGNQVQNVSNVDLAEIFFAPRLGTINRSGGNRSVTVASANVKRWIENYLKNGGLSTTPKAKALTLRMPQRYDVDFNSDSVEYKPYLTTSCIVNNPLNRYEFWAQNVSNENDKTYYGESVQLLPDEINKDGYLGEDNHTVELDVQKNWGIFLITRYKYVDYVYKVYYGFYGNAEMVAHVTDVPQYYGIVCATPEYTIGKIIKNARQISPNMYGWFWKSSYSEREFTTTGQKYYLTQDDILGEEQVVRDHLMQNIDPNNDIVWLNSSEIGPSQWNNYKNVWDLKNNNGVLPGKGDIYRYKNAVRTETIYYQVIVSYSVDKNGGHNVKPYILSVGSYDFDCADVITLCDCELEMGDGKCTIDTEDMVKTSTLTN